MTQGTPYVYQGEEIGMKNMVLHNIEEMQSILKPLMLIKNIHPMAGSHLEDMMRYINRKGRDNARTPMQWNAEKNAGFTTGTPWLMTNPCYTKINVAAQEEDPDSILNFYRKVIRLRKDYPIVVYGSYELLYPEHDQASMPMRESWDRKSFWLHVILQEKLWIWKFLRNSLKSQQNC